MLTQITMPYLPCMAIYAHLSGVLKARNRFIISAAAPILLNVWTLVAVLPPQDPTQAAYAACLGVIVVAGVSQAALLLVGRAQVRRASIRGTAADAGHQAADRAWPCPGAIASSATQINLFISAMLASQVNGARSWLTICDRLYQLPLSLVGVAIGVALLPRLSRRCMPAKDQATPTPPWTRRWSSRWRSACRRRRR